MHNDCIRDILKRGFHGRQAASYYPLIRLGVSGDADPISTHKNCVLSFDQIIEPFFRIIIMMMMTTPRG